MSGKLHDDLRAFEVLTAALNILYLDNRAIPRQQWTPYCW